MIVRVMGLPRLKQSPSERSHKFLDLYKYLFIYHSFYANKTYIDEWCKKMFKLPKKFT